MRIARVLRDLLPFATILPLSALAACGGAASSTGASSQQTSAHEASSSTAGPPKPWAQMTLDERRAYMSRTVLPLMQELFAQHDPERYANVSCTTCHGPDAAERNYELPNPSLLPLYPTGTQGQYQTVQQHEPMARFMFQRVTPTMSQLLGEPLYDDTTREGFGCYECHPHGDDPALLAPGQ